MVSQIGRTLQQVGFANLLWNKVEHLWYLYYTVLTAGSSRKDSDARYRGRGTGNKKRALILATAREALRGRPAAFENVQAIANRTDDAAVTRNALMHGDFHVLIDSGVANIAISRGGENFRPSILASVELDKALSNFIRTLKALVAEVDALLPPVPQLPPGVPGMLTSAGFVALLEEVIATEGGGPLDRPAMSGGEE